MTIIIDRNNQTVKLSNEQFSITWEEAGFIAENCKNKEDYEDQVNDWANDKEIDFDEIIVL